MPSKAPKRYVNNSALNMYLTCVTKSRITYMFNRECYRLLFFQTSNRRCPLTSSRLCSSSSSALCYRLRLPPFLLRWLGRNSPSFCLYFQTPFRLPGVPPTWSEEWTPECNGKAFLLEKARVVLLSNEVVERSAIDKWESRTLEIGG